MRSLLNWIKAHKKISLVIFIALLIIGLAGSSGNKNKTSSNQVATSQSPNTAKPATSQSQPETPNVPYQPIKNTVNETGTYLVALIDPSKDNETDMRNLCNEFHRAATISGKYYHADVYDDQTAVNDRDKVISDQASDTQNSNYDFHYIVIYNYNPGRDNHCAITLKGIDNPGQIDINY